MSIPVLPDRQLQKKFKHAADFGVHGPYNAASAGEYAEAIRAHLADPATQVIHGTFLRGSRRGGFPATFYLNPASSLVVVTDNAGVFVTGFRLTPQQLVIFLRTRALGGGF